MNTMANHVALEKTLWQAADKLRNNMDAAEYKHVVLGLIFLKFISDAFDELYRQLDTTKHETGADPEDKDIAAIAETYYLWRGKNAETAYKDIPGFCKSASIQDIRKNKYILTPGRYIDFKEAEDDGVAFAEKMKTLTATLFEQMEEETRLNELIRGNLRKIKH